MMVLPKGLRHARGRKCSAGLFAARSRGEIVQKRALGESRPPSFLEQLRKRNGFLQEKGIVSVTTTNHTISPFAGGRKSAAGLFPALVPLHRSGNAKRDVVARKKPSDAFSGGFPYVLKGFRLFVVRRDAEADQDFIRRPRTIGPFPLRVSISRASS